VAGDGLGESGGNLAEERLLFRCDVVIDAGHVACR
jgi:hypothetical protein